MGVQVSELTELARTYMQPGDLDSKFLKTQNCVSDSQKYPF